MRCQFTTDISLRSIPWRLKSTEIRFQPGLCTKPCGSSRCSRDRLVGWGGGNPFPIPYSADSSPPRTSTLSASRPSAPRICPPHFFMAGDTPGKDVHSRWTFLTSPIGCKKVNQEYVHQDETSMPSAAAPGKYLVNILFYCLAFLGRSARVALATSARSPFCAAAKRQLAGHTPFSVVVDG